MWLPNPVKRTLVPPVQPYRSIPISLLINSYFAEQCVTASARRMCMNSDVLKGKWKQMMGGLKQKWGDLTENDWTHINGDRDKLVGKIQERYGYAKDRAAREVDD